jgi:hypothetical protein
MARLIYVAPRNAREKSLPLFLGANDDRSYLIMAHGKNLDAVCKTVDERVPPEDRPDCYVNFHVVTGRSRENLMHQLDVGKRRSEMHAVQ